MEPTNFLFILSDEHSRLILGANGDTVVQTPHLNALANRGTNFVNAYCNSPICVPTRGSIATGRYVHQVGCWDSAQPYYGQAPSWGHTLMAAGHTVDAIGKLHYRDTKDSNGFSREILPMHILNGVGWAKGLQRDPLPPYDEAAEYADNIGPGESPYTQYDRRVTGNTCEWLRTRAEKGSEKPWVLFVGLVAPHYPLKAPSEFYELYESADIPEPALDDRHPTANHPAVAAVRGFFKYDRYFNPETARTARRSYYGLCSFLDHNIGQILHSLTDTGLADNTRVIYTSDHGDCLGNRGVWAKSVMYEESVTVPLIMAGPGVPQAHTVTTPVSHVDFYPTIVESAGQPLSAADRQLPGQSLLGLAQAEDPERTVFSEYHDGGSITGSYMIRRGQWKYIYHAGHDPQLFDLENDPGETRDLAGDEQYKSVCAECHRELLNICDPETVNRQAFGAQKQKIEEMGGEAQLGRLETFDFTPVPE